MYQHQILELASNSNFLKTGSIWIQPLFTEYVATPFSIFHKHTLPQQFSFTVAFAEEKVREF